MAESNLLGVSPQSLLAGAAVAQYSAVTVSAANTCIVTTAITDAVIGIAQTAATAAGQPVVVQTFGLAKVRASEAIAIGQQVMPTASGAGKVAVASGATAESIGVAMSAAGADGDVITILLALPAVKRPANA